MHDIVRIKRPSLHIMLKLYIQAPLHPRILKKKTSYVSRLHIFQLLMIPSVVPCMCMFEPYVKVLIPFELKLDWPTEAGRPT